MQNELWYNLQVPKQFQKKTEQVAIKMTPELHEALEKIRVAEDRPLGYIARELMIRGLALYKKDGLLRDLMVKSERSDNQKTRNGHGGRPLAPRSQKKMPLANPPKQPKEKKVA